MGFVLLFSAGCVDVLLLVRWYWRRFDPSFARDATPVRRMAHVGSLDSQQQNIQFLQQTMQRDQNIKSKMHIPTAKDVFAPDGAALQHSQHGVYRDNDDRIRDMWKDRGLVADDRSGSFEADEAEQMSTPVTFGPSAPAL